MRQWPADAQHGHMATSCIAACAHRACPIAHQIRSARDRYQLLITGTRSAAAWFPRFPRTWLAAWRRVTHPAGVVTAHPS